LNRSLIKKPKNSWQMNKPKIVKDYEKLEEAILEQIKLNYPRGFERNLITFKNAAGKFVSALPFETEEKYYLVRMTRAEAQDIIDDDDDYDEDGNLREDVKEEYEEKYEGDLTLDDEQVQEIADEEQDPTDDL